MSLQYIVDFESLHIGKHSAVLVVHWATPSLVLTGHLDGWLRAWRATDGALVAEVRAHNQSLYSLTASDDGAQALTSSIDGSVSLYSTAKVSSKANSVRHPQADTAKEEEVERAPSKIPLVGQAFKWEATVSRASLRQGDPTLTSHAFVTALHPTAPVFASTGQGATVSLHDARPGPDFGRLLTQQPPAAAAAAAVREGNSQFAQSIAFSPTGKLLAAGTSRGQVYLYNVSADRAQLTLCATYSAHALPVRALAFDNFQGKDNVLFVGADDGIITLHDVRSVAVAVDTSRGIAGAELNDTNPVAVLKGHRAGITALAPVPIAVAATAASQGSAASQTAATASSLTPAPAASSHHLLSSTSADATVRIWDLRTTPKSCVFTSNGQGASMTSISWNGPVALTSSQPTAGRARAHQHGFVTGASDGVVRWYRVAGSGGADL